VALPAGDTPYSIIINMDRFKKELFTGDNLDISAAAGWAGEIILARLIFCAAVLTLHFSWYSSKM